MTSPEPRPRLIVPPGWKLIPVRQDNREIAQEVFAEAWARGPRDSVGPFIHRMEDWLREMLDEAATAGGFAVAMPIGIPWLVPVSTAIVLSARAAGSQGAALPERGEQIETDAGPARRVIRDHAAPADAADDAVVLLRTVDYTWIAPGDGGFLVAFASISGMPVEEYAPVRDALTTLVTTILDAMDWDAPPARGGAA